MPSLSSGEPRRAYIIEERLVGRAVYLVYGRNAEDAADRWRRGERGDAMDVYVDNTGSITKPRRRPNDDR